MTAIRLLTKTQLKAERLKLAPGQQPAARYWQGQGWVYQYDASLAVSMKPYRPASPAQQAALAAGHQLVGTVLCRVCGEREDRRGVNGAGCCYRCVERVAKKQTEQVWLEVCQNAATLLALEPLFLDTETTGLGLDAEVVELAVLDRHGTVLFNSLVRPVVSISEESIAIHGITNEALADAPMWPAVAAALTDIISGRVLIAHNAEFDQRMLYQSSVRHSISALEPSSWVCTQDMLTGSNGGRWPSLLMAMEIAGAPSPELVGACRHRAVYDAHCCRNILLALANAVGEDS